MSITIPDQSNPEATSGFLGSPSNVSDKTLEPQSRVVKDVDGALQICDSIVYAWQKGIYNSARITAKINGERPWGKQQLKSKSKAYKRNVSTRFLQQMCAKVAPRFFMPLKQATTLTAAALPEGWPDGPVKSEKFRKRFTRTVRAWPKWDYFIEGLARETTNFGLGYAVWFDEYEWRPKLVRMDKGFVPQGTELLDEDVPFFVVKWQYHPDQLLKLLKAGVDAGRKEWNKDACVKAINKCMPPAVGPTFDKWRDYEDLVRQSVWSIAYYKAMRLVDTYHLFAREGDGKISHYIIWRDGVKAGESDKEDSRLLYQSLDEFDSIQDVCVPVPFGYGDGSVQGSWGVGQLLFDLSNHVEISRNEAMDLQAAQGRLKLQVSEGRNINDVKLTVNDEMMTVEGAQFAAPGAAQPANPAGFKTLDDETTMWAMQTVGNYVPPIPLQPSDTKAAAIQGAQNAENEVQNNNLQNYLKHVAYIMQGIAKRLGKKGNPDEAAKEFREKLLEEDMLTEEEIERLINLPAVETIAEFTPSFAAARAQFAASRMQNPGSAALYDPRKLEEIQAQAVPGGKAVLDYAMIPQQDQTVAAAAIRQQTMELAPLALGLDVPVLAEDNDPVHLQTIKPHLEQAVQSGMMQQAQAGLKHAAGHFVAANAKKSLPGDQSNQWKQWLADLEKALQVVQMKAAEHSMKQQILGGGVPGAAPVQQLPPGQPGTA